MYTYNLNKLLSPWIKKIPKKKIYGLQSDSRIVNSGDLFIAIKGHYSDGRNFIKHAINNGALAVLSDTKNKKKHGTYSMLHNVPIIYCSRLLSKISSIAERFYNTSSYNLQLIGVTGTNGKTSVTQIISNWIHLLGEKSAVMGTLGNGFYNFLKPTTNTTSSAIKIHSFLHHVYSQKAVLVALEISSHGLVQYRIQGLSFNVAIFTNFTHDHLDYHKNMNCYKNVKWSFLSKHNIKNVVINANDKTGREWLKKLYYKNTVAVGIHHKTIKSYSKKWINVKKITCLKNNINIIFNSTWGEGKLTSSLIGRYNIINLLLAMASLLILKYPLSSLISTSYKIRVVCGRMQKITKKGKPIIIIDYAHTPDALSKTLKTIKKQFYKKKLWCIFGCGGDRDQKKRAIMGNIAEKIANEVIITNDNPRKENPYEIAQDIINGCIKKKYISIILDREQAIKFVVTQAKPEDVILIAGKGHENYQIIGNEKKIMSDENIVLNSLKNYL